MNQINNNVLRITKNVNAIIILLEDQPSSGLGLYHYKVCGVVRK